MTAVVKGSKGKFPATAVAVLSAWIAFTAPVHAQQPLAKVKMGFASRAISVLTANVALPEILGYYKPEGISVEIVPLGSDATSTATLQSKRIEFSSSVPSVTLPLLAKGEKLDTKIIMEFVYPFKFQLAVMPDSPAKTVQDLKGKIIGVRAFGVSEYPVGQSVFAAAGSSDVKWLAAGENAAGGEALRRGDIAALFGQDVDFGVIEAMGIQMRYIPMPAGVPMIGGIYLQTRPDILKEHRSWAVGMIRGILKADIFMKENPEAAAYEFLQMFPEVGPKGKSLEEQVQAVMVPIVKRVPILSNYNKSAKPGWINEEELKDEISFGGLQDKLPLKTAEVLYTNELIDEANQFDPEPIRQQARNFILPYKK